jgi:hypothetical protein
LKSLVVLLFVIFSLPAMSVVKEYPTDFYCEVDNIEFLGNEFFSANCEDGEAHAFARQPSPTPLPTAQYYVLDYALPGQVVIDSALNLIRLENTFNGQQFFWASRARVFAHDIMNTMAANLVHSSKWSSENIQKLQKYISNLSFPQFYAIYYNDVVRGKAGEKVYFLIYDPLDATVLVINRVLYLK